MQLKRERKLCGDTVHLKNDASNEVHVNCDRLPHHNGAHRGRYQSSVVRWKKAKRQSPSKI